MSALCDTLVALNLTLGVFCQSADDGKAVALPEDDPSAWAITPPPPKPEPKTPQFPPVVIKEAAPPPPPAPTPSPAPVVEAKPEPKPTPPNPYRVALQATLSQSRLAPSTGFSVPVTSTDGKMELASLTPPGVGTPDMPPPRTQERYESDGKTSGLPVDNSRIIASDRYIHGNLEKGFNSQLDSASGGELIIQTSRDVFGYHNRNLLLPKGSRIKCTYTSPKKQGVSRIGPVCYRVLRAGDRAEMRLLNASAGDVQGHPGITGEVDNRFFEKYGTAIILASISAATRVATAAAASNSENSPLGNIADKGSEELSQKFSEISVSVTEQMVNLADIITASQGTRVVIMPSQDWYIQSIGDPQ